MLTEVHLDRGKRTGGRQSAAIRAWIGVGLAIACFNGVRGDAGASALAIQCRPGVTNLVLIGSDASQQLLATATEPVERDATREVSWSVTPSGLASVDRLGRVRPLTNGVGVISARLPDGRSAVLPLQVERREWVPPINFANRITPVFTKYGCNGGGCHGKIQGQNGFRLSLLGFEPAEDFEHLVKEARGRRVFPAAPDRSLLLLKGAAVVPHGGGQRLDPASEDYRLLARWIGSGMPYAQPGDPVVTNIAVFPRERTLALGGTQQLTVTAYLSDGSSEDATRMALYEPNDKEIARVDGLGLVSALDQPGEVAVMVRFQGRIAVFRATIPLGAAVAELPPEQNFIDELVFRQLRKVGMPPSRLCGDGEFLRRATIDIAGRLPTPEELDALSKDRSSTRREAVLNRLLGSDDYAEYFANKWSSLLRNKRTGARDAPATYAFHDWLRESLARNEPYDRLVRRIIAASGDISDNPPAAWFRQVRSMQNQLEDTAQLFLGVRIQCAQCHHHPYDRWSQADYWSFGAYFSEVGRVAPEAAGGEAIAPERGTAQATNKKTGQPVKPAALGDPAGPMAPDEDPRQRLADWMARPDNRFFARALVNRYWKHFLGRGLVEPEDDLRDSNPPTNPELLDALSADFIAHGFDLKHLVREITRSSVYQLSSEPNQHNGRDRQHFARFYPRRINAEVLYDAVDTLVAAQSHFEGMPVGARAVSLPDNSFNSGNYFLTVFGRPESSSACECERSTDASLSQSLHLLNAREIQERLALDTSRPAAMARESLDFTAQLRRLYRVALARDPLPDEIASATDYLRRKSSGAGDDKARGRVRREAFEDLVWALLNTKEFLFNH